MATQQPHTFVWFMLLGLTALVGGLYSLGSILMPFLAGFIGAYTLNAPVTWLSKQYLSRGLASAFLVLSLIIILITLMFVALPYLQQQLFLLASTIPRLIETLFQSIAPTLERISQDYGTPSADELKTQVISHLGDILTWSVRVLTNLLSNGMALANLLSLVILTPVITFYLLKDWPRMISRIDGLLPAKWASQIRNHIATVHYTLSSYAKGQAIICLILMILYSTSLGIIGLKQGVIVGILTGFMSFIPYIGMLIGYMTSLGISFADFTNWSSIGFVTLIFISISLIEGNVLIPRFIGQKIGLHPVWIIFALLAAGTWFGFMGILLALPITATLGVIARIILNWYVETPFYRQGAGNKAIRKRPKGVPQPL
jgi:predicted PurR-regulated permease PerM